jgi:tetratricopeptide (TPR) repeat protein
MIMAEANGQSGKSQQHALIAAGYLDRLLASGPASAADSETVSQAYNDISLTYKNFHRYDDAIVYARRAIAAARLSSRPQLRLSQALSMLANLLRLSGDLEGALQAVQEARANLGSARFPNERVRRSSLALVLSREAMILGAASGISLNRADEAIPLFQQAFDVLEAWTQDDLDDTLSRMLLATCGRNLGDIVRARDPKAALAIYDHALRRVREVTDNAEARRAEAELLAGASYALRKLGRFEESAERIDAALRLLTATGDYPAARVAPHGAVHEVLRARAEHLADAKQQREAIAVYRDLLNGMQASNPDPKNNLAHAVAVSHVSGALASLHSQIGRRDEAAAFAERRLDLWRHWEGRLGSGNAVVRRQLAAARAY